MMHIRATLSNGQVIVLDLSDGPYDLRDSFNLIAPDLKLAHVEIDYS